MRIFLSHSHRDRATAAILQNVLHENGAETFLDQDRIDAGDRLPDRLRQGIEWCNKVILVWSVSAARSQWVEAEWHLACDRRKDIIPYLLDHTSLPGPLDSLVYIEESDQQRGHGSLLTAVFGRGFSPRDPKQVVPGFWEMKLAVPDLAQVTYNLHLRANGQISGDAHLTACGAFGDLLRNQGVHHLVTGSGRCGGEWSFDNKSRKLRLDLEAFSGSQSKREIIEMTMLGGEGDDVIGHDLEGRQWHMHRTTGQGGSPLEGDTNAVDESCPSTERMPEWLHCIRDQKTIKAWLRSHRDVLSTGELNTLQVLNECFLTSERRETSFDAFNQALEDGTLMVVEGSAPAVRAPPKGDYQQGRLTEDELEEALFGGLALARDVGLTAKMAYALVKIPYGWQSEKDPAAARAIYKAFTVLNSSDAYFHNLLGRADWELGHLRKARASLERAVELAPDSPLYRLDLAEMVFHIYFLLDARKRKESEAELARLTQLKSSKEEREVAALAAAFLEEVIHTDDNESGQE